MERVQFRLVSFLLLLHFYVPTTLTSQLSLQGLIAKRLSEQAVITGVFSPPGICLGLLSCTTVVYGIPQCSSVLAYSRSRAFCDGRRQTHRKALLTGIRTPNLRQTEAWAYNYTTAPTPCFQYRPTTILALCFGGNVSVGTVYWAFVASKPSHNGCHIIFLNRVLIV